MVANDRVRGEQLLTAFHNSVSVSVNHLDISRGYDANIGAFVFVNAEDILVYREINIVMNRYVAESVAQISLL